MTKRLFVLGVVLVIGLFGAAKDAAAQLDPLLFIKRTKPNVLIAVETANRMQRDAVDPNDYIDANVYTKTGALWETSLGIAGANTSTNYRRKYVNLQHTDPASSGGDKFEADDIDIVGDLQGSTYNNFDERTRLTIARRALIAAVTANTKVARFGLLKTRQNNPVLGAEKNEGPVKIPDSGWLLFLGTETGNSDKWKITRPEVSAQNSSVGATLPLVKPDDANANATILTTLGKKVGEAGALTPGGKDSKTTTDAPLDNLLDDVKTEAARLTGIDTECRNTVVVLIVSGGEGNTSGEDAAAKASQFLNIGANHRVPIYVIALNPDASDEAQLQAIAANSGGQYTKITAAMVTAATPGQPVPEVVRAINIAISHAFATQAHFDTDPTAPLPFGPSTEHQVTSPTIGTVEIEGAKDINGAALTLDVIYQPGSSPPVKIPQRSNLLLTSAFTLPGFDAKLRAFRVYQPEADSTKPSGYKFKAAGTPLWIAKVPSAALRNIYTALPDGTLIKFDVANAAVLQPYLNTTDTSGLINFVRSQPLGAVVGSTPAIMDPPSLDPPPDSDYPAFSVANKDRRSMVWVGANDGMLHAIDARLGEEVWAFIPFNLLPKLHTLRSGQPVGDFRYFVDSSPKISDVKVDGQWRTYLIIGEGAGGTFYQTFDVTLDNMAATVVPTNNTIATVLGYFASSTSVPLKWAFPRYSSFNTAPGAGSADAAAIAALPYGDLDAGASAVEKTVGETWSDPAVGQIETATGKFSVLTGSGFLKYSVQQQPNRGGVVAGTTFYLLDVKTGDVFDSRSVGSDGQAENVDDCASAGDCTKLKNALHADPVATGPPDSRYITKAYMGDLDGRIWRFDLALDASLRPSISTAPTRLYSAGAAHPLFASMATVNVGGAQQYLFVGTGS